MNVVIDIEKFMTWLKERESAMGSAAIPMVNKYLHQQFQEVKYSCPIIDEVHTFMDQHFDSERVDKKLKQQMLAKLEELRHINARLRMCAEENFERLKVA